MDGELSGQNSLADATPTSNNDNYSPSEPSNANTSVGTPGANIPQGIPSLETLSQDPIRTHRTWEPKYGRVQKCDWCNARAAGTLHVCTACTIRMCEDCARNRLWYRNRTHFIDADTLDWVMKKIKRAPRQPKPPKKTKPVKKKVPAKRAATASPDQEPKTPGAPRRVKFEEPWGTAPGDEDDYDDDDDDLAGDGNSFASTDPRQHHFPAPVHPHYGHPHHQQMPNYYDHNQEGLRYQQAAMHGSYTAYGRMEPPLPGYHPGSRVPAPATPFVAESSSGQGGRRAAAKAKQNIREQSHRSADSHDDDDVEDDGDNELGSQQDEDDNEVHEEKGNKSRRRSDRNAHSGSQMSIDRDRTSPPQASASQDSHMSVDPPALTPQEREHDRLVVDIYNWMYGNRPSLNPHRVRTQIPDRWSGPRQPSVPPSYHHEPSPYGHGPYPPAHPAYSQGQFHGNSQQQHMRPPPGYPSYNTQQPYQEYNQHPIHPQYQPPAGNNNNNNNNNNTTRPAPTYPTTEHRHQHNQQVQQQQQQQRIQRAHQQQQADQALLDEMCRAWAHNTVLQRLVASNHRVYAVQLLWDVCELRRRLAVDIAVVGDGDNGNSGSEDSGDGDGGNAASDAAYASSQTVRWFVAERDSQFRMEHEQNRREAREREQAQAEAQARERERDAVFQTEDRARQQAIYRQYEHGMEQARLTQGCVAHSQAKMREQAQVQKNAQMPAPTQVQAQAQTQQQPRTAARPQTPTQPPRQAQPTSMHAERRAREREQAMEWEAEMREREQAQAVLARDANTTSGSSSVDHAAHHQGGSAGSGATTAAGGSSDQGAKGGEMESEGGGGEKH